MKKSMLVLFSLALPFYFSAVAAQTQGQVQMILGSVSAVAGEEVSVPVELSIGTDRQVGQLSFEIQFPKNLLSFEKTDLAVGLDSATVELTARPIEKEQDPNSGFVLINLTGKNILPSSSVASLVFTINMDVYEDQEVTIKATVVSAKGPNGEDISEVATVNGEVLISGSP